MYSTEYGIKKCSEYFIYTPSILAKKIYFYPLIIGHYFYEKNFSFTRNSLDSFLIIYIEDGSCAFQNNNTSFTAIEGDVVLLNCYTPHSYYSQQGFNCKWIHFDGTLAQQNYDYLVNTNGNIIHLKNNYRFIKYIDKIFNTFKNNETIKESLLNNWIVNILTELSICGSYDNRKTETTLSITERTITYIHEHLAEHLTISELASKVSLSKFYFIKAFTKETGFTPHYYIIESRINASKYLLITTDKSIKEICYTTGFNSENSFCVTFKKCTGVTPSTYRKTHRNKICSFTNP